MENYFKLILKPKLENVGLARVAISSFVSNINITIDELMDIKTALSEAVTNSVEHGYEGIIETNDMVEIECKLIEQEEILVEIKITDYGKGIDDIELAMTPTYTSKPELEHAGMGFTIMETFMDEILIESNLGKGTKIIMKKIIKKRKSL